MIINRAVYKSYTVTGPYAEYTFGPESSSINVTQTATIHNFTNIPAAFLNGATQLTTVDVSDCPALTGIGNQAFMGCTELVADVFPATVLAIGSNSFNGASKVAYTTLPDALAVLPSNCFYRATALALTQLPSSLESIGYNALTSTAVSFTLIPSTVTSMGSTCLSGCNSLINLEIGATAIGTGVNQFSNCTGLRKVWIRNTCTSINAPSASLSPFLGCSSSLTIYVEASGAPSGWGAYFNRIGDGSASASVVYGQATKPW